VYTPSNLTILMSVSRLRELGQLEYGKPLMVRLWKLMTEKILGK